MRLVSPDRVLYVVADKAELIKRELNLKRGGSVADVVKAANEQLGNNPAS